MTDLAKIEKIYHAALEKTPMEREAFIRASCGDDEQLRSEVESLLSFDEKARSFIESPPDDLAAAFIDSNHNNEKLIGREFNHYRVLSLLGAGGMGEVYLAEDKKLGRKVALKLLPTQFSANPERKVRFEQEARAASALNHPNIITIYSIEEFDGLNFIATEFIDGETLRERLACAPLSVAETLDIVIQLSSALEASHSVGVIHRDIKPANIMLRRDRIAKILDFGLAKLTTSNANHFESRDLTGQRRVMGTINYMSPEQALGERLDARTDIFSLGVVLYEMLTGVQPFSGNSDAAIYDAILNKDAPPLTDIGQNLPHGLEEIISRAMKKNSDERFQTAHDFRISLENIRQKINSGEAVAASQSLKQKIKIPWKKVAVVAALAAIFTTAVFLFLNKSPGVAPSQTVKNVNYVQLTKLSGAEMFPSLSPDGKTILYSSRSEGNWDIFFQRVGGMNAVNLTKDSKADDKQGVYSPDGNSIVFRSERDGGGIFIMGATGESVKRLTDSGYYPSWSPDGKEIVFSVDNFDEPMVRGTIASILWIVKVDTGEKRRLTEQDSIQPDWSPSGARIAFWGYKTGGQRDIWTISAKGESLVQVTDDAAIDWNPVWSADGKYLYFVSDRSGSMNLWRVPIEESTGKVLGEPETITTPSTYSQHVSFSRDGKQFAYVQSVNHSNITSVDFDSQNEKVIEDKTSEITRGAMLVTNSAISHDGELILFDNVGDKQEDIFVVKRDGTELRQLTNDAYKDRAPRWSPDGKQIAFFSDRTGKYESWIINTDGSNLQQITNTTKENPTQLPVWSPDGKKLLFNLASSYPIIFDTSVPWESQTPEKLPSYNEPNQWLLAFSWSPDGKKIAGGRRTHDSNVSGIYEYSFATRQYEKLSDFGVRPVWLSDSRRMLFYDKDKIYLLDNQTKKVKEIMSVAPNRIRSIAISKDNKTIFYSLQKTEADIWLGTFE